MPLDSVNFEVLDRDGLSPDDLALEGYRDPVSLILARARYLITSKGWCRGSMARRWMFWPLLDPLSPHAERFCSLGAIHRAAYDLGYHAKNGCHKGFVGKAVQRLEQYTRSYGLIDWNDSHAGGKPGVVAAFDRALAR